MAFVARIGIVALGFAILLEAGQRQGEVEYVGGNVHELPVHTRGYLQLRDDHQAAFHTTRGTIRLPYHVLDFLLVRKWRSATLHLYVKDEDKGTLSMVFRLPRSAAMPMAGLLKERTSAAKKRAAQVTSSRLESSLR